MSDNPYQLGKVAQTWADRVKGQPDEAFHLLKIAFNGKLKLEDRDKQLLAIMARKMLPNDQLLRQISNPLMMEAIPEWHWDMLADTKRNDAYAKAIAASVTPEDTVLEIGTGSGLLAILAAKAGAKHVYTVEYSPVLAQIALENSAENGVADRVTVICKDIRHVTLGDDIPHRCTALVHEIIADNIIAEHVIPFTAYAREHLLTPDAVMIPNAVHAKVQLINSMPKPFDAQVCGVSLAGMEKLRPGRTSHGHGAQSIALSDPLDTFYMRFDEPVLSPAAKSKVSLTCTQAGTVRALELWFEIGFPDGSKFENINQPAGLLHWRHMHYGLTTQDVEVGQTIDLICEYRGPLLFFYDDKTAKQKPLFGWPFKN